MTYDRCLELTEKLTKYYSAPHSNLRASSRPAVHRIFVQKAAGSRFWDADGNEYIDYLGAMGPNILGHRHPEYVQALKDFLDEQSVSIGAGAFNTCDDIEVAEKLNGHVPCAEKVKFCVTGSEAVQMAIRLARAYTKRPYFIRFGRHYHGWMDNVLGGMVNQTPQGRPFAAEDPGFDPRYTQGRAPGANEESLLLPWNDEEALERALERYGEEVALIHFEALVCNRCCMMPKPGFLEKIRDLCDRYGIVMSIDEVITGFRLGLDGAQGHFGVTPDLATFGKAMAGGAPMSAVAGKAAIMDQLRTNDVLGPGTFNGFPLGMRAVLATLKILERNQGEAYAAMERVQQRLTDGLRELAEKHGIPMAIQGARGVFFTMFGLEPGTAVYTEQDLEKLDSGRVASFWGAMREEGIVLIPDGRWYPSIAHTEEDVDRTLEAADKVLARIKKRRKLSTPAQPVGPTAAQQ